MTEASFVPTPQQRGIINHDGSAFVTACPGAGKTRVIVERARSLFQRLPPGRGVALISFTHGAIAEMETRLMRSGSLPSPMFPSFIGTFDSFVWNFLIAPFGLFSSNARPRLVPDMHTWVVVPFKNARALPLSCFDPSSGAIDPDAAKRQGFDTSEKSVSQLRTYITAARRLRDESRARGQLGFSEARAEAIRRLDDARIAPLIANALAARFCELIVDEAQDCNPDDLRIVSWLRNSGMPTKVICDPHQSIYGFRGGITDQLFSFEREFAEQDRKQLSGNFRSSRNICRAIAMLRPAGSNTPDEPSGEFKDVPWRIQLLAYAGSSVPSSIGSAFRDLVSGINEDISKCPVLAATSDSGSAAVGRTRGTHKKDATFRLARAVAEFHAPSSLDDVKSALETAHRIVLEIEKAVTESSLYHLYLLDNDITPESWRPTLAQMLRDLRFMPNVGAREWHERAKEVLKRVVAPSAEGSIAQKLRWNSALEDLLSPVPSESPPPRTIHSVKGLEFPAVCVVLTTRTLGSILGFLECGERSEQAEDARKLYVAASRAQKLLVFAVPKNQATRFGAHLRKQGAEVLERSI